MKRRRFGILSALSLLLCMAMLVLWTRSYGAGTYDVPLPGPPSRFRISSFDGEWGINITSSHTPTGVGYVPPGTWSYELGFFMVANTHYYLPPPASYSWWNFRLRLPCSVTVVLFALLPARWWTLHRRWKQEKRAKAGLCLTCGYDLRASKERCPECGAAIPSELAAGCETKVI